MAAKPYPQVVLRFADELCRAPALRAARIHPDQYDAIGYPLDKITRRLDGMTGADKHFPTNDSDSPKTKFRTKKEFLEFLRTPEPGVKAREYVTLTEAAERLGCRANDLLDEGLAGKRDIYAPVLEEELYGWPVTDKGMRHSHVLGMAFPVFHRRLNAGDKGILTKGDIERIRQGELVTPEGYLLPELTLRDIEAWEATQSETRASERMRVLVKTVAWVHPSRLKSESGHLSPPTRVLGLGMLSIDAEGIPVRRLLTIDELASAFQQRLERAHPRGKVQLVGDDWEDIFKKPRKEMLRARGTDGEKGPRGKKGVWNPVKAGIVLHEEYAYQWSQLNPVFKSHESLRLWWQEWVYVTRPRGNHEVDAFE